jgi:hypothetical protein
MFIMTSKEIKLQNAQLKMDHCIKERQSITMLMDIFLQDINLKMGRNMGNRLTILKMGRFREKNNIKMGRCMENILAFLKMERFREKNNLKMGLQ